MPKRVLKPLLVMNLAFVVALVTLGPRYGWNTMIVIACFVSMINLLIVRSASQPPRS